MFIYFHSKCCSMRDISIMIIVQLMVSFVNIRVKMTTLTC